MLLDDVVRMRELLAEECYAFAYLWEENRDAVDGEGMQTPTAFVLKDAEGREFDVHAMRLDDEGNGRSAWEAPGFTFSHRDLSGVGTIAGHPVRCVTAESQIALHTGYELPEMHARDVVLLRERFGFVQDTDPLLRGEDVFIHNVYFWLKDGLDADAVKVFEAGLQVLCDSPPAKAGAWGKPAPGEARDVVDGSFTYGLHVVFDDAAGHEAYQVGEVHQSFLAGNASKWERVLVYDTVSA